MSAVTPLTANLLPQSAGGITLYQGQPCTISLFEILFPRYLGAPITRTFITSGNLDRHNDIIRLSGTAPAGMTVNSAYGGNWTGTLAGTPTTLGTTNVLIKIELSDYQYNNVLSTTLNAVKSVGYVSVPITVAAVPTTAPAEVDSVIIIDTINAVKGSSLSFTLSAAISTYPLYWSGTGLPAGLNIEGSTLQGYPSETGTTTATLSLRYKPDYDAAYITETKEVQIVVTAAVEAPAGGPAYLGTGGIDLFLDLQSMALSLDLPKPETVISADAQVINATVKQLVVKPDQILDLNVRFTKGTSVVDPNPATMRFGIGTKIGGPLLMLGSTFTKVGSGSGAYFKMRVTSDSLEFDAIQQDYYDEDAVEQITADNTPGREEPPDGICELEFSTGSGATLATFRSDSLAVLIRRSLLAGI